MKYPLLLLISLFIVAACSTTKTTQKAINTGNYNKAIYLAVSQLQKNKTRKGNQKYVFMLEEAFAKAVNRDLNRVSYLRKESNPEYLEEIFNLYEGLSQRQELINPLLPLQKFDMNTEAKFEFKNYNNELIKSKNDVANYLYNKAISSIDTSNKLELRSIYYDLEYLDKIIPNFKDIRTLMNDVHSRGIDYVRVSLINSTDKVIPNRLEDDLLNFDTYDLNDLWTVYHSTPIESVKYDFDLKIDFRSILISPEKVREKEIIREKLIKDGKENALDTNGNQLKDSIGDAIQVDRMIIVRCEILEIRQFKSADLNATIQYIDNTSQQVVQTYSLSSGYLFEHYYATHRGDRRALERRYAELIGFASAPFPSNEQMIFAVGQDLKWRVKNIIVNNEFR